MTTYLVIEVVNHCDWPGVFGRDMEFTTLNIRCFGFVHKLLT